MYEPIAIENLGDGWLCGYSDVLGLYVCWEDGRLRFFDPVTVTYLYSRADIAENRAETAEARAAELEAEIRRMRGE